MHKTLCCTVVLRRDVQPPPLGGWLLLQLRRLLRAQQMASTLVEPLILTDESELVAQGAEAVRSALQALGGGRCIDIVA